MTIDTSIPRTRRALLAGGIGGAAALVASALGRPLPARAGSDGDVVLGAENWASSATVIRNSGSTGLIAAGGTTGIEGDSGKGSGVFGYYGPGNVLIPIGFKTGVYGYAVQDAESRGVYGVSSTGQGVSGVASTGQGVRGATQSGYGVRGFATTGTAGYFATEKPTAGYALRAVGRVRLDKASGVATILAGNTAVLVTPGLDVTSTSFALLTPKADLGTRRLWYTTNTTTNTITIRVSSAVTADLKVGWLLLG